jgi:hypothetical protein
LIVTGVGALGVVSFSYFGLSGRRLESNLANSCAPYCSDEQRDQVLRDYQIADVSLGVGAVALGVGAWLLLARARPHAVSAIPAGWAAVIPARGGASAAVGATF